MVRLVSAIEVASTTLRRPGGAGAIARSWSRAVQRAVERRDVDRRRAQPLRQQPRDAADLALRPAGRPARRPSRRQAPASTARAIASSRRSTPDRGRDSGSRPERRGPALSITGASPSRPATGRRRAWPTSRRMRRSSRSTRLARRGPRPGPGRHPGSLVEFVEQHGGDAVQAGIIEDHAGEDALGDHLDPRPGRNARLAAARGSRRSRPPVSPRVAAMRAAAARAASRRGSSTMILPPASRARPARQAARAWSCPRPAARRARRSGRFRARQARPAGHRRWEGTGRRHASRRCGASRAGAQWASPRVHGHPARSFQPTRATVQERAGCPCTRGPLNYDFARLCLLRHGRFGALPP